VKKLGKVDGNIKNIYLKRFFVRKLQYAPIINYFQLIPKNGICNNCYTTLYQMSGVYQI